MPLRVHTVRYEAMVEDLEREVRPLLEFLDLPWEEAVLDHQQTAAGRGYIRTPSYAQVTEKVYGRASGRWRRYEKHLEPVLPVLLPWAERLGYGSADEDRKEEAEPPPQPTDSGADSPDPDLVFQQALTAVRDQTEEAAVAKVDQALERSPDHGRLWLASGLLHRALDELAPAVQAFDRAAELMPEDVPVAHGRARAHLRRRPSRHVAVRRRLPPRAARRQAPSRQDRGDSR